MVEKQQRQQQYFLLGEDVSASLSPAMMNAAFRSSGVDAEYRAVSVGRGDFQERFAQLREVASGMNLTIPYKSDAVPLLDGLDEVSARIGAVNVVKVEDGGAPNGSSGKRRALGYNTDVNGITAPLREHLRHSVRSALLVGAGGAARSFCEAMNQLGCTRITVTVRDGRKGESFIAEMSKVFPRINFDFTVVSRLRVTDADLIFNATPIGSSGGEHELPESLKRVIYGRATVFDAVYRPMKTELLKTAEMRGCATIYGYEMLLNQGTLAFEIWTSKKAPRETMRRSLLDSLGVAS